MQKCVPLQEKRSKTEQQPKQKHSFTSAARLFILQIPPKSSSNEAKLNWYIQNAKPWRIWKTTRLCVLYKVILLPIEIVYLRLWGIKREHKIMTTIKYVSLGSWLAEGRCCGSSGQRVKLLHMGVYLVMHFEHYVAHAQTLSYSMSSPQLRPIYPHPLCISEPNMATESFWGPFQANRKIRTTSGPRNNALLKRTNHPHCCTADI